MKPRRRRRRRVDSDTRRLVQAEVVVGRGRVVEKDEDRERDGAAGALMLAQEPEEIAATAE
jgi:electron transfer flavoprotein alpha subunit